MKTNEFAIKRKKVAESVKPVEQPKVVKPEDLTMPEFVFESADRQYRRTLSEQQVDMKGKKCTACKKGTYEETDIHDNMHGELHCTKCNTVIKSRQPADSKKKRVSEGAEKEYHVINHKGTPTVVSPSGKMNKNFSSTYDAQQFAKKKNAEIDKKKNVSEGIMDVVKQTFNDCVVGYPQGTSEGQFIQGWARAIRAETGRDIPLEKLAKLYQDYTERSDEIMQSHGTLDESGVAEQQVGEAGGSFTAAGHYNNMIFQQNLNNLGQQLSQLSPADLEQFNQIAASVGIGSVAGVAGVIGAVTFGDMFMSVMRRTMGAAKKKVSVDTEEIIKLRRQIVSIHKRLATLKTEPAIAKYQAMLKQAFEVLEELEARQGNQVAEGKPQKRADRYHINKDGKPASLASYADRSSAVKDRDAQYPGAKVHQVGPRGKVKGEFEEGRRLDMSSPEEKAARKAYIKAHGHPPPLTPDSVVAKYNPENDKKMRDYYLRRKGIPQDKLDKMKEDGVAEASPRQHPKRYQSAIDAFNRFMDEPESTPKDELQSRHDQTKKRIKTNTMAGPKGQLPEAGTGDINRLEHRGEEYNVYFNQRKGMYTARGTGQMKGQIQFEWFHTLADAIDHAEMEIGGYDEHDGVVEGSMPDLDHMPGKTTQHKNTNCTTCHGHKSRYKLNGKLFADNRPGAVRVKCSACDGTGEMTAYQKLLKQMKQNAKNDPHRIPRGYELSAHGQLVKKHKTEKSNDGVGGLGEGLKEDATGGSTGSSSVSAVVTELGAGGMTKQQLRKRQADYTNVRKTGGPVKVKRNG